MAGAILDKFNVNFKPSGKGFEKILGKLEASIMEILWRRSEASVREVFEELSAKRPLAYTTVLSTMRNLERKGFLQRSKSGTAHLYRPSYTQEKLARLTVNQVLNGLLDGFGQPFLAGLTDAGHEKELTETIEHLEKLLDESDGGEQRE
jgi:predicted transcriptional regulator